MTDNVLDLANYEPAFADRPEHCGSLRCRDCGGWGWAGGELRHNSLCDIAPRKTILVEDVAATSSPAEAPSLKRRAIDPVITDDTDWNDLSRRAADGTAPAYYSDDDIYDAVRMGIISESEALNQDC